MHKFVTTIALLLMLIASSCRRDTDPQLAWALQLAEDNANELQRVLAHYDSTGEPLKAEAAAFLIRNMPGLSTAHGYTLRHLYAMQDTMYATANGDFLHAYRFNKFYLDSMDWGDIRWRPDIHKMKSDYLIRNINRAFDVWPQTWNANVDFNTFCESILPYRLADEELEDWRDDFLQAYPELMDTLRAGASPSTLCEMMNKRFQAHNYMYKGNIPSLRPSSLRQTLIAPCSDYTKLCIYICRSLGIPAHFDFTPQWANYPHGHEWCAILDNGEWADFMLGEKVELGGHLRKCMNALSKVYRKTFALQSPDALPVAYATEDVPPFFRNKRQIDVTDLYMPTTSVGVTDLFDDVKGRGEYVYLCVFDNYNWNAVGYGKREGNTVRFDKVGTREAVYLPAYYINGQYVAAQHPIRVFNNGDFETLCPDTMHTQEVRLTRKYYETRVNAFMMGVRGGTVELSSDATFRHADTLKIPSDAGFNFQTLKAHGNYRYVRFRPAKGVGQLGEMEVYAPDGKEIEATAFSGGAIVAGHEADKLTDKNTLSYAECNLAKDPSSWIGVDLGRSQPVAHIDILGRSDDNFIKDGETYKLEYFDREWHSLGTRVGKRKTQTLTYRNAPRNALFRLRNLTKGQEERIFLWGYPTNTTKADFQSGKAQEKQLWY